MTLPCFSSILIDSALYAEMLGGYVLMVQRFAEGARANSYGDPRRLPPPLTLGGEPLVSRDDPAVKFYHPLFYLRQACRDPFTVLPGYLAGWYFLKRDWSSFFGCFALLSLLCLVLDQVQELHLPTPGHRYRLTGKKVLWSMASGLWFASLTYLVVVISWVLLLGGMAISAGKSSQRRRY
jgi:hypothetical protein